MRVFALHVLSYDNSSMSDSRIGGDDETGKLFLVFATQPTGFIGGSQALKA